MWERVGHLVQVSCRPRGAPSHGPRQYRRASGSLGPGRPPEAKWCGGLELDDVENQVLSPSAGWFLDLNLTKWWILVLRLLLGGSWI